eukprot:gene35065-41280_t
MVFSFLLGANVLVEQVFAWPGIGAYAVNAVIASDYAAVQGFVLMMAILYVLLNLAVDLLATAIDPRVDLRHVALGNGLTVIAGGILALFVLLAVVGPAIAPWDPLLSSAALTLKPPSASHWFGTDALGRDIFSRVIIATRLDLGMALGAVALSFALGTALGSIAGYIGGLLDTIIGRLMDTIMAFPLFVLAMGIVAALGNSVGNIVLATAIINLPFYVRFARAEVNVRRDLTYVEAARMGGNGPVRILVVHIVPNILPTMMVQ